MSQYSSSDRPIAKIASNSKSHLFEEEIEIFNFNLHGFLKDPIF